MSRPVLRAIDTGPARQGHLTLGMAQLSPFGLSEQWLLRDCGDRHWGLIADAAGSNMAFRDACGTPVYAAFCATSVTWHEAPMLGARATVNSTLHDVAPQRIGSLHTISGAQGSYATVRMISCFLKHDSSGSNTRLLRSGLTTLKDLPQAPAALDHLHLRARMLARLARKATPEQPHFHYRPVPALDFNAVGLLYFPVFSKIAEMAAPRDDRPKQRTVVYLGNLNPGESTNVSRHGAHSVIRAADRLIGLVETS